MKTQLSIQMRILGLKDLASSLAQPLYDFVFGDANLQPTISANLLSEGRQISQPGSAYRLFSPGRNEGRGNSAGMISPSVPDPTGVARAISAGRPITSRVIAVPSSSSRSRPRTIPYRSPSAL